MEIQEKIKKLEEFKYLLNRYFEKYDAEVRSEINKNKKWVKREVLEAGCFKTFTIGPPPAIGGLIMRNVDPFEVMFNPPYNMNVSLVVKDMIDETIGVIAADETKETSKKALISVEPDYEKGYAFIAMAIDSSNSDLEDVLDSIKETADKCGIHAERVDEVQSNDRITDRILESINKAQFVIVDLTHSKPNVFYEAGYAQGLKKTPIYIARHGTPLAFDLKDYPVIFFNNMRELKSKLEDRLRALALKYNY